MLSNSLEHPQTGLDRRNFLKQVIISATGTATLSGKYCLGLGAAVSKPAKPNILWIVAEDLCPDLHCYGTPLVKTPNIDKLAAEGAMFTNAFSSAPVCSASRSAILTGMY